MKTLSNQAFNKFLNILAANGKGGITSERLSVILDADKDESIDAYFFGRLAGCDIVNEDKLLDLLEKNVRQYLCQGKELQKMTVTRVEIISVAKIEIYYSYIYAHADCEAVTRNTSMRLLATDDRIDGIFNFVYKD